MNQQRVRRQPRRARCGPRAAIAFADSQGPLASPHGWTWEYDSGGVDRVTAVSCQTYECDVLAVSDLLGASQVRLGRVNQ